MENFEIAISAVTQGTRKSDGRNMTVRNCAYEDYGNSCNGIKVLNFNGQVSTIENVKHKNPKSSIPDGKALLFVRTQLGHHVSLFIGLANKGVR